MDIISCVFLLVSREENELTFFTNSHDSDEALYEGK